MCFLEQSWKLGTDQLNITYGLLILFTHLLLERLHFFVDLYITLQFNESVNDGIEQKKKKLNGKNRRKKILEKYRKIRKEAKFHVIVIVKIKIGNIRGNRWRKMTSV